MYTTCAACKFLRRKCTQDCVFAPYFPSHLPMKFISVHKVYGASTVAKLLRELPVSQRRDAANSLVFEAEARLKDPIYGCVGSIAILQHRLKQVQTALLAAKQELQATYMEPSSANVPVLNPGYMQMQQFPTFGDQVMPSNMQPTMSGHQGPGIAQQQQEYYQAQQQLYEAHLAEAARQEEMLRNFQLQQLYQQELLQQHQHQHQQSVDSRGFDGAGPSEQLNSTGGFTHLTGPAETMTPSLAMGGLYEEQLLVQQHQQQEQHHHDQHLVQQQEQHHDHQLLVQQQQLQPPLMPHQFLDEHQPQPQPPQLQPPLMPHQFLDEHQPQPQPPQLQQQLQPPLISHQFLDEHQPQPQPPQPVANLG